MDSAYVQRLTAAVLLLAGLTAAAIVATPSVSPVAGQRRGDVLLTVPGITLSIGAALSLAAVALGTAFFSALLIALLPLLLTYLAEFAAIVVPARPEMAVTLVVIPGLYGHALYVYASASLREEEWSDEMLNRWHPWKRRFVAWLRAKSRRGRAGRLIQSLASAEERHWTWRLLLPIGTPLLITTVAAWAAVQLGMINARTSTHIAVSSQALFAACALATLVGGPSVAYLALREKQRDS